MSQPEVDAIDPQIELVSRLANLSEVLALYLPEGTLWHVVSPSFREPNTMLDNYSVSEQLKRMSQAGGDYLVRQHRLPEDWDGDDFSPACYVWEMHPPRGFSFLGSFVTECHNSLNLPGFGVTFFCPEINQTLTQDELDALIEHGALNLDIFHWYSSGERFYDKAKPESVLCAMLERHPIASLETALWLLEGIQTAKDIHPEKQEIKLDS